MVHRAEEPQSVSLEPTKHRHPDATIKSFHKITSLPVFQEKFSITGIKPAASFKKGYFLPVTSVGV